MHRGISDHGRCSIADRFRFNIVLLNISLYQPVTLFVFVRIRYFTHSNQFIHHIGSRYLQTSTSILKRPKVVPLHSLKLPIWSMTPTYICDIQPFRRFPTRISLGFIFKEKENRKNMFLDQPSYINVKIIMFKNT
jgi:hypothetical protein